MALLAPNLKRVIRYTAAATAVLLTAAVIPASASHRTLPVRWDLLKHVHRVAVVFPCLCTDALDAKPATDARRDYQNALRTLINSYARELPSDLGKSGRFTVARAKRTTELLWIERWRPVDLFVPVVGGARPMFPTPDRHRAAFLARKLKADAVLLTAMREPASQTETLQLRHEGWDPNPLNWKLQRIRQHVVSPRVSVTLITAGGVVVWHDEEMADHPRTKQRTPRTLLIDWTEATQQVAQQVVDSLTRLPPPEKPQNKLSSPPG